MLPSECCLARITGDAIKRSPPTELVSPRVYIYSRENSIVFPNIDAVSLKKRRIVTSLFLFRKITVKSNNERSKLLHLFNRNRSFSSN